MKRDLISVDDFGQKAILEYLKRAEKMENLDRERKLDLLRGKVLAVLFYEPSTRTRLSFEAAMVRLGGSVIGFTDPDCSSFAKGETLRDTVKTVEQYSDVIVIRHPHEGAARLSAEAVSVPIINAGDGANQHPTQTLLDLYTIWKHFNRLDNLKIALVGDLNYSRTIHSLIHALAMFKGIEFFLVSPESLRISEHYKTRLRENRHVVHESNDLPAAMRQCDIIYMTRIQRERFADPLDYEKVKDSFCIDLEMVKLAQPHAKILHPLPRVNEITPEVDDTAQAGYFNQVRNGLIMRQAILYHVLQGA